MQRENLRQVPPEPLAAEEVSANKKSSRRGGRKGGRKKGAKASSLFSGATDKLFQDWPDQRNL